MYNPYKKTSWDFVKEELKPIMEGREGYGKASDRVLVVASHMIKGHA